MTASGQQAVFTNQQHFDVEDGLPQSYISDIVQDRDGFIWAGTYDGLTRYDGRGFKNFHYRPNDSTSFTANTIQGFGPLVDNTITLFYEGIREDIFNLETHNISRSHARATLENIPGV